MSIRMAILLVLAALIAACGKRTWQESKEIGAFKLTEHWHEYAWAPELSNSYGVDYFETQNTASGDFYWHSREFRGGHIADHKTSISQDRKYVFIYYNNINGRLLEKFELAFFDTTTGERIPCRIDGQLRMGEVLNVGLRWYGPLAVGSTAIGSIFDENSVLDKSIFFVDMRDGCTLSVLKNISYKYSDADIGPSHLNTDTMDLAWGSCEESCWITVLNVLTREERTIPTERCPTVMPEGEISWVDGELKHVCGRSDFPPPERRRR